MHLTRKKTRKLFLPFASCGTAVFIVLPLLLPFPILTPLLTTTPVSLELGGIILGRPITPGPFAVQPAPQVRTGPFPYFAVPLIKRRLEPPAREGPRAATPSFSRKLIKPARFKSPWRPKGSDGSTTHRRGTTRGERFAIIIATTHLREIPSLSV